MRTAIESEKKEKIADLIMLITIIGIMLALTYPAQAMPQIQLIGQTDPLEYGEIQTIRLDITASSTNTTTNTTSNITITQAIIKLGEQNYTLEQADRHYAYAWLPEQKGMNSYIIYATDSASQTGYYTNSFQVIDTIPPAIIDIWPRGIINYNLVEIKVITDENSTCKYDQANVSYDSMAYSLSSQGVNHTQLRSFENGEVTLYAKCKDISNNVGQSQAISFRIDTIPPTITEIAPTGTVNQADISLRVTTDEIATCRYGKTSQAYESLENQFQITGATLHEQPLKLSQGINTYYIGCKDQAGNKNEIIILNLELNIPPTASISVERNNTYRALSQGTHYLSLTTSKSLSQAPTLGLRIGNRITNIPLEGSSQSWNGYFIIPPDTGDDVGEFQFEGTDAKGTVGTEITSGKLILIDASIPPAPTSLKLSNENNKIKLSWEYAGEEVDHFNIYRSTTGNTDKANFKTVVLQKNYLDSDVTNKIGYFYRISAVDEAGNEGLLSDEEFVMAEFQNITNQFQQDPGILSIVNSKIVDLEKIIQDLEIKISKLEETTDQDMVEIVNQEDLLTKQREIKSKIQTLIGELKSYRETKLTKDEIGAKIGVISTKVEEYQKGIIKEVIIADKAQKEQSFDENIVQESVNEYLKNKALTGQKKDVYIQRTKDLQGEARIQQELIIYEIGYEYKESEKITLIKETITSSEELKGVIVQEVIPKEVLKISGISFLTSPKDFNEIGVQWPLDGLAGSGIEYSTREEKDLTKLQGIRTVLLYDFDWFLSSLSDNSLNESGQITGKATLEKGPGSPITKIALIALGIIIIIVLLTYYFVFLKTETFYEKDVMAGLEVQEKNILKSINLNKASADESSALEPNAKIPKPSLNSMNSVDLLIQQAYEELKLGNVESASQIYSVALSVYAQAKVNMVNKLKVNFKMNSLRADILEAKKPKDLYT